MEKHTHHTITRLDGGANCYLIRTEDAFILIDTGFPNRRRRVEKGLAEQGCRPGNLKLILITHGDSDHTGNAAYLSRLYQAPVAMHPLDFEMARTGDLLVNRKVNVFSKALMKLAALTPLMLRPKDRFQPDLKCDDGWGLEAYGLAARVVHVPGHSAGSIALLTAAGDLFSGDLIMCEKGRVIFSSFYMDRPQGRASLEKLRALPVRRVYPGHGESFDWDLYLKAPL